MKEIWLQRKKILSPWDLIAEKRILISMRFDCRGKSPWEIWLWRNILYKIWFAEERKISMHKIVWEFWLLLKTNKQTIRQTKPDSSRLSRMCEKWEEQNVWMEKQKNLWEKHKKKCVKKNLQKNCWETRRMCDEETIKRICEKQESMCDEELSKGFLRNREQMSEEHPSKGFLRNRKQFLKNHLQKDFWETESMSEEQPSKEWIYEEQKRNVWRPIKRMNSWETERDVWRNIIKNEFLRNRKRCLKNHNKEWIFWEECLRIKKQRLKNRRQCLMNRKKERKKEFLSQKQKQNVWESEQWILKDCNPHCDVVRLCES